MIIGIFYLWMLNFDQNHRKKRNFRIACVQEQNMVKIVIDASQWTHSVPKGGAPITVV